jgi:tetratricopeptide (TPR) repeat protein
MADPTGPNDELGQAEGEPRGVAPEAGVRVVRRKRSMWDDRRVRAMGTFAVLMLIAFLATLISVLYFGLIGGESAPRTALERDVVVTESVVRSQEETPTADNWQSYVLALIADNQHQRARQTIAEVDANGAVDQSRGANMLYCSAVLAHAQGRTDEALDLFTEVMDVTLEAYTTELERPEDDTPNWALAMGVHRNYLLSALDRANIYREQERWDEMLDEYLEFEPRAANVLADRAHLKLQTGDREGAEADYREALRYVPDLPEALEGLQTIGVDE